MSLSNKKISEEDRRQYIRLDSVFPVSFRLLALDGKTVLSEQIQAFTSDISRGGLCLSVNDLKSEFIEMIRKKKVKFSLNIEIPLHKTPVKAKAHVAWMADIVDQAESKCFIGLAYDDAPAALTNRIFRYALSKKLLPRFVLGLLFILFFSLSLSSYLNYKLIRGNKALIEQFVDILQKSSIAKQDIKKLNQEKEELNLKLSEMGIQLKALEQEKARIFEAEEAKLIAQRQAKEKIKGLIDSIERLEIEKLELQEKLISLQTKESRITEDLLLLDRKKSDLEKANFEKMYDWLRTHQNLRSGLVLSYEGDNQLHNWSFLYDQALAAIAYVKFSDFERARKIFDFFKSKAKRVDGGFLNAYYANSGEPAEYIVHCGPNIWLGIALMHYTKRTNDNSYLSLALEIGNWVINIQEQDKDAGIRGGPRIYWYSTEHNLDAYAFFTMLYEITGRNKYNQAAEKTLKWLMINIYSRPDIPILRGKGDATIATDTYAWSIAAIGPDRLEKLGMNPEKIVEFAEETCAVESEYTRPTGERVKVKGFDFAPMKHVARGGVVSSEWTAQMILAYKLIADFYYRKELTVKARSYEMKADDYLMQLGKLIISSPSPAGLGEGCLPYATQDSVDTGHGWATPSGSSTGSVAGTAYTLFAYYGYNPLELPD